MCLVSKVSSAKKTEEKYKEKIEEKIEQRRFLELAEFQNDLNIDFVDISLLSRAFMHSSLSKKENNERLEFVGDAVLGLVVSDELYKRLDGKSEGMLAKIKAFVVCEETLAQIGFMFGFERYLSLGKGEEKTGGRKKKALIADTVEAVIGAYYIDSGFEKAKKLVLFLVSCFISSAIKNGVWNDYKSLLQVMLRKAYKTAPSYVVEGIEGPDHDRTFWISVTAAGNTYGPLSGKSKKGAEQAVAKLAYEALFNK